MGMIGKGGPFHQFGLVSLKKGKSNWGKIKMVGEQGNKILGN